MKTFKQTLVEARQPRAPMPPNTIDKVAEALEIFKQAHQHLVNTLHEHYQRDPPGHNDYDYNEDTDEHYEDTTNDSLRQHGARKQAEFAALNITDSLNRNPDSVQTHNKHTMWDDLREHRRSGYNIMQHAEDYEVD